MILNLPQLDAPLNVESLFGRSGPLEIEIGMGKGKFLRERAIAFPDHNYLGIEKSQKWLRHAVDRFEKAKLTQIRVIPVYVEGFLERYVQDESVAEYHINFPDPWPKKRHQKRRMIQPLLVEQMCRTLAPEGVIHIATDFIDYYQHMAEVFAPFAKSNRLHVDLEPEPLSMLSNYHVKYLAEGRKIYFIRAIRTPV